MFKELAQMLAEGDALAINVVAVKEGRLSLTVVPVGEFKHKDLGSGLSLEATPQEFDDELAGHLQGYVNQRKSLKEQLDTQTMVLAEAEKASKQTTAKAISKSAATPAKSKTAVTQAKTEAKSEGATDQNEQGGDEGGEATAGGDGGAVELF